MDGEEIGIFLARALQIRSKVDECLTKCSNGEVGNENGGADAQCLIGIRDALDLLERQLAELQALQQQQRYERESVLLQIDRGRMVLLNKLNEYEGKDLEVLHEAATFAGEKIEHDDGLLLHPYPSHLPDLFAWNSFYPNSQRTGNYKLSQNGHAANLKHETSKTQNKSTSTLKSLKGILGFVAKSTITVVGLISVLSLAGYQPTIKKWPIQVKASQLFGTGSAEVPDAVCPPGKVLVVEDGKGRCVVKERVQVPFESDVKSLDIRYGLG